MKRNACGWLRFFACLLLAVTVSGLFSGCRTLEKTENAPLLRAPQTQPESEELLAAARRDLGAAALLKYPVGGETSSPFFFWDADGDGAEDVLVLYQNTLKSKNVQLALLRCGKEGWYAAHMDVEGRGGDVTDVCTAHLTPGADQLLVCYQDASGTGRTVCCYQWINGALRQTAECACQRYALFDPDDNGLLQLAAVQQGNFFGLLQLTVLGFDAEDQWTALREQSSVLLDARFARCLYFSVEDSDGESVAVMDFQDGSGRCLGECMSWSGERFVRCYLEETGNIPNFTSRDFGGLLPSDIDKDGRTELPCVESRVLETGTAVRFCFISWHQFDSRQTQRRGYSFVDLQEGYRLMLPEGWYGRVVLQPDGGGVWSVRTVDTGQRLLSVRCADLQETGGVYTEVGMLGTRRVWVLFTDEVTRSERSIVMDGLQPLY